MKTLDMTEGKPFVLMAKFSVPMLFANVLQLVYTLADAAIIGRMLGVSAFASVGATGNLYWLVFSMVLGVTHGFGAVFGQRFGAKDSGELGRSFSTAALLTVILGVATAFAGVILCAPSLTLLNTPPELMGGAVLYLSLMLGGMPITFAYNLLGSMLRSLGDSRTPLEAVILGTILNITLDFALVIPFGIGGVAVATLLAQVITCAYCVDRLRGFEEARPKRQNLSAESAKPLLLLGLPSGLRNVVIGVGGLIVQNYVNGYGANFVAGIAAAIRMHHLLFIAGGALEASCAAFVAQNFGAGKFERVKSGVATALKLMLLSSVVIAAFTFVFRHELLSLFIAGEPEQVAAVLDIGQRQLAILALGLPVLYLLVLYRAALQGIGKSFIPMLSGFLECVARIFSVTLATRVLGVWGVYLADPAAWVPTAALLITAYLIEYRKILRQFEKT